MTEPTHHYRPDVEAQLDLLMDITRGQESRALEEAARTALRLALAGAWTVGWIHGRVPVDGDELPAQNPYDEMAAAQAEAGRLRRPAI